MVSFKLEYISQMVWFIVNIINSLLANFPLFETWNKSNLGIGREMSSVLWNSQLQYMMFVVGEM